MRLRSLLIGLLGLLGLVPSVAAAQGLAARFGHTRAVEGEPLIVRVILEDAACAQSGAVPCLVDTVGRVEVDLRVVSGTAGGQKAWSTRQARQESRGTWVATFTSTAVPHRVDPNRPASIELRARVLGIREGVLLELGDDAPLEVAVVSAPEARAEERAFGEGRSPETLTLVGFVGTEARAGSSARVRAVIGVGARASRAVEIGLGVAVGPSFLVPAGLDGGGPIALAFDGSARIFTRDPATSLVTFFLEPFVTADLRLPGLDTGVGMRAGIAYNLTHDVGLEASLGGALVLLRARDPEARDSELGATGGLRVLLRFGGRDVAGR